MKEVVDAISARIKAPYFGYSVLAFIAFNWKGFFYLFASTGTPEERLALFDSQTNFSSLVVYPLVAGLVVAASTLWISFLFARLESKPRRLLDVLQLEEENRKIIKQKELEKSRSELFALQEEALIDRAKRDEVVSTIEDEEAKKKLMLELAEIRSKQDKNSSSEVDDLDFLTTEAKTLLIEAAASDGVIEKDDYHEDLYITVNNMTFGHDNARDRAIYDAALIELKSSGLIKSGNSSGTTQQFELTAAGWRAAEELDAPLAF